MNEIREQHVGIYLSEEEEQLLYNLSVELTTTPSEVVGRALRVLQKCREFIGE